jgi:ribosomal protein S18 acetylase RimI-like enzyme
VSASGTPALRRAASGDVPGLAAMLARAFIDDPVAEWSCRPDSLRRSVLERFYTTRTGQLLADDEVWVTGEQTSAALWAPPKRWKLTALQDARLSGALLHPRLLARAPLVVVGLLGLERNHPVAPPHWYLAFLGTDPSAQGQGLGSAVLRPVLEQCDSDGIADGVAAYLESSKEDKPNMQGPMPAYLESSKESNISFYERFGFKVIGEHRLPRGPKVWPMWRDPPRL